MLDTATPVEEIEGVGEKFGSLLKNAGINTVYDLLSVSAAGLDSLFEKNRISKSMFIKFRRSALFLQIDSIDNQIAESLTEHDFKTLDSLCDVPLSHLSSKIEESFKNHKIPEMPSIDRLARIQVEAALFSKTGRWFGVVTDGSGNPIEGVTVQSGRWAKAQTDTEGRFALSGLPLGQRINIRLSKSGYMIKTIENIKPITDSWAVVFKKINLKETVPDYVATEKSELDGQPLPIFQGYRMKVKTLDVPLRDGDYLKYKEHDQKRNEAILVSRLKRFVDGEFIIERYRVKTCLLPKNTSVGEHFIVEQGNLKVTEFSILNLQRYRQSLIVKRFKNTQPASSNIDRKEQYREFFSALLNAGPLTNRFKKQY